MNLKKLTFTGGIGLGLAIGIIILLGILSGGGNNGSPQIDPLVDNQRFLNQQVAHVQHRFAVLDFYNSKDPGGVEHLKALRQVVQDPAYADWVEVVPVDLADEAKLAAAKGFLGSDIWENSMPYTLVVRMQEGGGCIASAGNAFIPEIYGTPEVQIREALDTALKPRSERWRGR